MSVNRPGHPFGPRQYAVIKPVFYQPRLASERLYPANAIPFSITIEKILDRTRLPPMLSDPQPATCLAQRIASAVSTP